jgi:hypothetical protein
MVPAVGSVTLNPAPGGKLAESNAPLSAVTVCGWVASLVQWTLSPALIVSVGGSKPASVMRT